MKRILFALLVLSIFLLGFTMGKKDDRSLVGNKKMTQVGIITDDIEKTAKAWTNFLGLETVPEIITASGHSSRPTEYRGKATDAEALLAFFQLDNITVELIQPLGEKSTWQEFLDENGPGIHHVAFEVDAMAPRVNRFHENGIPEIQHGGWGSGEYAYMDGTGNLELIIELLENY